MGDIKLKELAAIALDVYEDNKVIVPDGWTRGHTDDHSSSGFYASTYNKGSQTVLAFRGTASNPGWEMAKDFIHGNITNALIGHSIQSIKALAVWDRVANQSGGELFLTGHSLGGALVTASVLGYFGGGDTRVKGAATFCAPGISLSTLPTRPFRSLTDYPVANILVNKDLVSNLPGLIAGKTRWINLPGSGSSSYAKLTSNHAMKDVYDSIDKDGALKEMTLSQAIKTFDKPMKAYFNPSSYA